MYFKNCYETKVSLDANIESLKKINDFISKAGYQHDSIVTLFGESITGKLAVICEAIMLFCCINDYPSEEKDLIPSIKDLKEYSGNMIIPDSIKEVSSFIVKAESPDFRNQLTDDDFIKCIMHIQDFLTWIYDNNASESLKGYSKYVMEIADWFLPVATLGE